MMSIQSCPHRYLLCVFFCISLSTSCTSQNQNKQENQQIDVAALTTFTQAEIDTSLRLRFSTGIRSILEDSHGNIWFGSHQEGLCLFDGKKMQYFGEEHGLSNRQVRSIFEDANGTVWFECGYGISSYNGSKLIKHSEMNYTEKQAWEAKETDLWFKGDEHIGYNSKEGKAGVYRYDGKELKYYVFPVASSPHGANHYSVSTPFVKGKNARLWFGT